MDWNRDGYWGVKPHQSQTKAGHLFAEDNGQGEGEQDVVPLKDSVRQNAQKDGAWHQLQQQIFEGGCFKIFAEDKEENATILSFCAGGIVRVSFAFPCVEPAEHRHFRQE